MTNYDMTMAMLAASTFHPDSVEQARKYLRDLKASHDALLVAGKMYMDRVSVDIESNYELEALYAMIEALKAAEALR